MQESDREKQIVIIVDGDATRRFLTAVFLQRLAYHVFAVRTAEEALIILELTAPLLIISEITLPQMSGIDLLRTIKETPATRHIPLLIYTALKDPSHRQACEQAGCAGYLTQPADHNQLYEAVQKSTTNPRRFVRLPTSLDVIIEGATQRDGAAGKERVTMISEHGMYVATNNPLERDAEVRFTLFLDRAIAWGILVQGKVLYSTPAGMGVKFTLIRPEDQELIRTFIGKKLLEGIAVPTGKNRHGDGETR